MAWVPRLPHSIRPTAWPATAKATCSSPTSAAPASVVLIGSVSESVVQRPRAPGRPGLRPIGSRVGSQRHSDRGLSTMKNAIWGMLNETEKALLREVEPKRLNKLDEDGLADRGLE